MLSIILYDEYNKKELIDTLDRSGYEYRLIFGPESDSYSDIYKTYQRAIMRSPTTGALVKAIVNLYDGSDTRGHFLTELLDAQPIPTTCSCGPLYDISREEVKSICNKTGVATPHYFFYDLSDPVEMIREKLIEMSKKGVETIFIKPSRGYGSEGITKKSRQPININDTVHFSLLIKMIQEMAENYGSSLVEEFIDGREISALIVPPLHPGEEPIVFKPIEFDYKKSQLATNFLTKEDKSDASVDLYWYEKMIYSGLGCDKSMNYIKKIYQEFGFKSYVRFDIRIRETKQEGANEPLVECYIVDVNPCCSVFVPCTAVSILEANGKDNDWFLNHIIESSVNLKNKK